MTKRKYTYDEDMDSTIYTFLKKGSLQQQGIDGKDEYLFTGEWNVLFKDIISECNQPQIMKENVIDSNGDLFVPITKSLETDSYWYQFYSSKEKS